MNRYDFSHARVGFLLAIQNDLKKPSEEVLIPDYICESIPNYLLANNIKVKFYQINFNLRIDWDHLQKSITRNSKFLVVVNYFGFPLDLEKSIVFAKKNNLILIEDSTHCHNGKLRDKFLGTFGDYGVTSPRKHIPIRYGGTLFTNKNLNLNKLSIHYKTSIYNYINFFCSKNFLNIKLNIKKLIKKNISNLPFEYEEIIKMGLLDNFSKKVIYKTDWDSVSIYKNNNYKFWQEFCKKRNLNIIIKKKYDSINPWALPILVKNDQEVINWINWGRRNNVIIFNWPTLYKGIKNSSNAYSLSKRIVCFSTYTKL